MQPPESNSSSTQLSSFERARTRLFSSIRAQQNLRLVVFGITLLALAGGGWAAFYAYDRGFTKRWRKSIIEELGQHGVFATIGRLTIDPVEGLVARNVFLYDDPKKKRLLANIDRISLDIDLGNFVRNEPFLSKIDFKNADLSLPLEPEEKNGDTLRIRDFSANVLMENDRIEITRASGQLSGVAFSIQGSMLGYSGTHWGSPQDKSTTRERMKSLKRRRALAYTLAQAIERFKFRGPTPRMDIEISGDMADADSLRGSVAFSGEQITHRDYPIVSVSGALELQRGELSLQHMILNDEDGELHLSGGHRIGTKKVDFQIDSSASLNQLLRALNDDFKVAGLYFDEAPKITAEGTYDWGFVAANQGDTSSEAAPARPLGLPLPLKMIGSAQCEDFTYEETRLGGSLDFNIDHDRLYLRNVAIENAKSGTLDGELLITPDENFYEARLRMDPTLLDRFLPEGSLKSLLASTRFPEDSSVQVEMEGQRVDGDLQEWTHRAEIDLRDFEINGQAIDRLECDVAVDQTRVVFEDVRIERDKASAFEPQATWSIGEKKLTLSSLTSALDPVSTAAIFSPKLAAHLSRYSFESSPNLQLKGTIDPDNIANCDLTAVVTSRGASSFTAGDYDLSFTGVSGNLLLKQGILTLNFTGKSAENTTVSGLTFTEASQLAFAGRFPIGESPIPPAYKVEATARTGASFHIAGVDFPLPTFRGDIVSEGTELHITANAVPFDGDLSVSIVVPRTDLPGYKSTVHASEIDFGKLARHLSPDFETQGTFEVLCSFSGVGDRPASIDGGGEMRLSNGNVFAIPLLGPLSPVVAKLYKKRPVSYSVARQATAGFRILGGRVVTENFTSSTGAFTLHGRGEVDFLNDRVDLDASLKARSAVGVLLYPVSRLFKFSANGTMTDPQWQWLDRSSPETTVSDEDSSQ